MGFRQLLLRVTSSVRGVQTRMSGGSSGWIMTLSILVAAFFLADIPLLSVTTFLGGLQSTTAPTSDNPFSSMKNESSTEGLSELEVISQRNLFNSLGKIPGLAELEQDFSQPVKSALPYKLLGTMILGDSRRSVAALEDPSDQLTHALRIDDEIENKLKVTKVVAGRVEFKNLQSGRPEFIEIEKEDEEIGDPVFQDEIMEMPVSRSQSSPRFKPVEMEGD